MFLINRAIIGGKQIFLSSLPHPPPFKINKDFLFYDFPVKFKEKVTEENFKIVENWCDSLEKKWAPGKAKCRLLAFHDGALHFYVEVVALDPIKEKLSANFFSLKRHFLFPLRLNSELKSLYKDFEENLISKFADTTIIELIRQDRNGYYTAFENPLLNKKAHHLHMLASHHKSHIMRIILHRKDQEERDAASKLLWLTGLTKKDAHLLIKAITSSQREVENNIARLFLSFPDEFISEELKGPLFKACVKMSAGNNYPVLIKAFLIMNSLLEKIEVLLNI